MNRTLCIASILALILTMQVEAAEPNETFAMATLLPPGVLSVSDELTLGEVQYPDTLLGIRNALGVITHIDDDGSPIGNGTASGAADQPTHSGSIQFAISGTGDFEFDGSHSESGQYEVFVDVYDLFDDQVDSFSEVRTLEPGAVHEFHFSESEWINGSYDVYIDNTVGPASGSDVDFFTFSGLTPGMGFTARTLNVGPFSIDTLLGWFDSDGMLLESNDNDGGGMLSLIQGIVPNTGNLSFAVTGSMDSEFIGSHAMEGVYELQLELGSVHLVGDYNNDNAVNAADYVVWRHTLGQMGAGLAADGNNDNRVDDGDYTLWRSHFGNSATANATLIPEPSAGLLLLSGIALVTLNRRYRRGA